MPRSVDQHRHAERRDAILQEAYRQFAASGYDRTTTASICRGAGISSGTFFHYFPTKLDALIGVLRAGAEHTRDTLRRIEDAGPGAGAVFAYAEHLRDEMSDPHFGGFVHAVAGVEQVPEVAGVLADEAATVRGFLTRHLAAAAPAGEIRTDVGAERLATWTQWLLDGAAQSAAGPAGPPGDVVAALRALLTTPGGGNRRSSV